MSRVFGSLGTTIFEVMSGLAREAGAINLGQGFPDIDGPEDVRRAAAEATIDGPNQYPSMMGIPELRQAIARHNGRFYGLDVDWQREVLVTSGATEALGAALMGVLNPGDRVILFEPLYDSYIPICRLIGAEPLVVTLSPPDWSVPMDVVAAHLAEGARSILINSPMNPCGKVFDAAELDALAALLVRHDAVAVCDEVYEHLVFDGRQHAPLMARPGMRERTARIGSAGKIFSLTGWKVGWVTAAPALLQPITKAHQFLTFTTAPNLQRGVAFGLAKDDGYFLGLAADQQAKRDRLSHGLARIGFQVLPSGGTYFISADFRPLGFNGTDEDFCRHITTEAKVAAVPVSAFYAGEAPRHLARFCFCKRDEVLDEAVERLARHFGRG
ncbi:MAG: aminotransferase [Alphaproteobacteria bacterium]|nr:aminotransferase [Alphaproteobacteria bacterium]